MLERLQNLDSRIIYGFLVIAILLPFFVQVDVPVEVGPMTQSAYDVVESLDDGAKVLISHDYAFGTQAELDPIVIALYNHLASKNAKIMAISSVPDGPMLARDTLKTCENLGMTYGEDYVNLGFFAGEEAGLAAFAKDVRGVLRTDFYDTPLDDLPIMDGVSTIEDFDLVVTANAGTGANIDAWVRQVAVPYKSKLITGVTAILIPRNMPFVQAGQITASVGGLRGGAEYERLIDTKGPATLAMNAQSSTQLFLLVLILVGNIGYWASLKQKSSAGGATNGN